MCLLFDIFIFQFQMWMIKFLVVTLIRYHILNGLGKHLLLYFFTQVQRGAAPSLRISRKKGSFLGPPHVRDFVKEGYLFAPRYEVWG